MMTPQIFTGLLLLLVAAIYGITALQMKRSVVATTAKLRNPEVHQKWIERDLPLCHAYLKASLFASGAIALCGIYVIVVNRVA